MLKFYGRFFTRMTIISINLLLGLVLTKKTVKFINLSNHETNVLTKNLLVVCDVFYKDLCTKKRSERLPNYRGYRSSYHKFAI